MGEHEALLSNLRSDPIMRRFFKLIRFEEGLASDRLPNELYLHEVELRDLQMRLFDTDCGSEY